MHRRLQPRDGTNGRPRWLITWDTLADQAAKARGEAATFRWLRPRTIIYTAALLIGLGVMVSALATRTSLGLSVLHDRAPLFVPLADGSLRNGYTIKVINKQSKPTPMNSPCLGLAGATMTEPEEGLGPTTRLGLPVNADSVGTFRVLVKANPDRLENGRQQLDFILRNPETGEHVEYRSVFMGPATQRR